MTRNMGGVDRTVRFVVALLIALLWISGAIGGALAVLLAVVAFAFLATSLIGWCPLYAPFHLSTRKPAPDQPA